MVNASVPDTRARLIRFFTFLGGVYFFIHFLLSEEKVKATGIQAHHEEISNGFIVVGVMALGLGIINIVRAHGARCIFKRPGWLNSFALLAGLIAMVWTTSAQWIEGSATTADIRQVQILGEFAARIVEDAGSPEHSGRVPPVTQRVSALLRYGGEQSYRLEGFVGSQRTDNGENVSEVLAQEVLSSLTTVQTGLQSLQSRNWDTLTDDDKEALIRFSQEAAKLSSSYSIFRRAVDSHTATQVAYNFLYDGLFNQLGSAMFALLGVYIAAAVFRAFRIRTIESALMMTAAVVVMLGQISFGKEIYEHMPSIRQWLLEVPNSAAFRAIRLGAGVAGLMLAIRMWLSIESKSFSSGGK